MTDDPSPRLTRRHIIRSVAAVNALAITGCLDEDEPTDSENTTTTPSNVNETAPTDSGNGEQSDNSSETDDDDSPEEEIEESWGDHNPTGETLYTDDPNWRMLGHDTGNTFTNPHASGPSDDPSIRWALEGETAGVIDDYIHYHPLIVDGTVYTSIETEATRDSRDRSHWKFLAIDAQTGETSTLFTADGRIWRPTIVNGTVYVAVGRTVRAYDLDTGDQIWQQELPDRPSAIRCADGVVVVTRKASSLHILTETPHIWGYGAESGELLWKQEMRNVAQMPRLPIVADGAVRSPDEPVARTLESGEPLTALPADTKYSTLDNGFVYGLVGSADETTLAAYDWSTLEEQWRYQPESGEPVRFGWPVVVDDVVVASQGGDGFFGLDRETGEHRWHVDRPYEAYLPSMFRVATDETVYIVHEGGAVTALDPTDGTYRWTFRTDELDWEYIRGCALADDLLITVGNGGTLYAIS